eukprot:6196079-Pleurochrysis_carterae.AAC.1
MEYVCTTQNSRSCCMTRSKSRAHSNPSIGSHSATFSQHRALTAEQKIWSLRAASFLCQHWCAPVCSVVSGMQLHLSPSARHYLHGFKNCVYVVFLCKAAYQSRRPC